jgi:hypothetical protein
MHDKIISWLIITISVFVLLSCNSGVNEKLSYWQSQRSSFKYTNKSEFFTDSALLADLKYLRKLPLKVNPRIDSVYLYSWQDGNSKNVEFTVIGMEGMYGPAIFYVIFNKNDSLLSSKIIAGSTEEGDTWFDFGSVFLSRDTFQEISKEEFMSQSKSEKYKSDLKSSFYTIESNGSFMMNMNIVDSIDVNK